MYREIRELDRVELARPAPGAVAPWVRVVVGAAAVTAIAVAAVIPRAAWQTDPSAIPSNGFWFQNGLWLALAAAAAAVFLPPSRSSRFIRLATLLPLLLLAALAVSWALWEQIAPGMPYLRHYGALLLEVPICGMLPALAGVIALAALALRPRRLEVWIRTIVVIALLHLLLLGLWLPLASSWWGSRELVRELTTGFVLGSHASLFAFALAPPLVLAIAFAGLSLHQPELARRLRAMGPAALLVMLPIAVVARLGADFNGQIVYLNLVLLLAASGFVAAVALVGLVVALWLRGRAARRRLARERTAVIGTIPGAPDDPRGVIACLELEGWLSGLRPLVDSFEVATPTGRIPIPVGAGLVASVPADSSFLEPGESVAVIRRGDRVVVSGLVEPDAGHPFRSAATLVPGPAGVLVRRHDDPGDGGLAAIALVAWRPCVAYLMILTAVALPGLFAALLLH